MRDVGAGRPAPRQPRLQPWRLQGLGVRARRPGPPGVLAGPIVDSIVSTVPVGWPSSRRGNREDRAALPWRFRNPGTGGGGPRQTGRDGNLSTCSPHTGSGLKHRGGPGIDAGMGGSGTGGSGSGSGIGSGSGGKGGWGGKGCSAWGMTTPLRADRERLVASLPSARSSSIYPLERPFSRSSRLGARRRPPRDRDLGGDAPGPQFIHGDLQRGQAGERGGGKPTTAREPADLGSSALQTPRSPTPDAQPARDLYSLREKGEETAAAGGSGSRRLSGEAAPGLLGVTRAAAGRFRSVSSVASGRRLTPPRRDDRREDAIRRLQAEIETFVTLSGVSR